MATTLLGGGGLADRAADSHRAGGGGGLAGGGPVAAAVGVPRSRRRDWSGPGLRLGDGGPFWLYPVVEAARRDHQFLVRLEAIRLNRSTLVEGQHDHGAELRFNKARADRDYAEAFRDQGLGEPPDDPEGVAERVRASRWAAHLVAALDDWAVCAADPARQDWLLGVARRADPDPWRDRVRDPAAWRDGKALAELARAAPPASSPYRCCWRWANG